MKISTRVRKRTRLVGNRRAGVYLNWRKLGPDGWRQLVPVPSTLSVHALGQTWNPQRHTVYTNLPGPVDTVTRYGEAEAAAKREPTALELIVARTLPCTVPTCRAQPDADCQTPAGRPASRPHKPRIEAARAEIRRRGDTTPGGRSRLPGPISPLGRLVSRVLGWLAVVLLAWLLGLVLGAHSWLDVITAEVGL